MEAEEIEYRIINSYKYDHNQIWAVDVAYHKKGACKCSAKKTQLTFTHEPSDQDIINKLVN